MQERKIPFFNYPEIFRLRKTEYMCIVEDVLNRGAYILQKDLRDFEMNIANYLGVKHAIGVGNCTDGLTLVLRAVGVRAGDEVLFPSHTFVATAEAIYNVGAIPVPVDCGPDHLMSPESAEKAITSKTRAIIPVQLNGRAGNMEAIQEITRRHGLLLVEDAAQSLGAKYKGQYAGTFGVAAAFSFYPAKVLGCFGDAGMVVTNEDQIAEMIFVLRDHGRNSAGRVVMWGQNSRLDNLQAAILNFNFGQYKGILQKRRDLARFYEENLRGVSEITLPPGPDSDPAHFDIYQNYEIEAEQRDQLKEYLDQAGIGTVIQWGGIPVHQIRELGFKQHLPGTDRLFARCLMLPMNSTLSAEDVSYVSRSIKNFYSASTPILSW